uniref:Uncharacterized protein LOC114912812 n=1 Tax=Elaeis guineensis var. tenera TaxID=51953 RepID=A0A8N4IAL5_ELAGV
MDESKPIDYARENIGEGGGKSEKLLVEECPSCPPIDKESPGGATLADQQQPPVAANHAEALDRSADDAVALCGADEVLCPENDDGSKTKKSDSLRACNLDLSNGEKKESSSVDASSINERVGSTVVPLVYGNGVDDNLEIKQPLEVCLTGSADNQLPCSIPLQETERFAKSSSSKMNGAGKEELASSAEASSLAVTADPDYVHAKYPQYSHSLIEEGDKTDLYSRMGLRDVSYSPSTGSKLHDLNKTQLEPSRLLDILTKKSSFLGSFTSIPEIRSHNRVLNHCVLSDEEYMVLFTPNYKDAMMLIGESYPFFRYNYYVTIIDDEVDYIREFARRKESKVISIPETWLDLRIKGSQLSQYFRRKCSYRPKGLFSYPAKVRGIRYSMHWVSESHR